MGHSPWGFSIYTDFFSRIMIILFLSLFFTLLIQLFGSLIYLSKRERTLLSSITFI